MSKLRILIVEDEAVTAADLHDELTARGYEVVGTTDTAAGALRLAEAEKPDLVLMDINLVGSIDGVVGASAIRDAEIPVVFLTAHYDERTLARAKEASPVGYVTKPFEPQQLAVAIEIGIARHRSEMERLRLVWELEKERALVKSLTGLLPICPCCQMIQGENGLWQSIGSYVTTHSEATFRHCYCPVCESRANDNTDRAEESFRNGEGAP
jgi:DNA-binding response OmpR family regulator